MENHALFNMFQIAIAADGRSIPCHHLVQPRGFSTHLLSLRRRRFCGFSLCLQASLNKLMETLDQSEPYFVKCIRSNAEKVSSAFKLLMEQLFFSLFFSVH